jgi:hypothetical protein
VGHQEGDGEIMRCAQQGGDPTQIGIAKSDFESISAFGCSSYAWKDKEIRFPTKPVL